MVKYVDHSKADKARRKKLVSLGITTKAKAKELLKVYSMLQVYGVYLDGTTEIGVSVNSVFAKPKGIEILKAMI